MMNREAAERLKAWLESDEHVTQCTAHNYLEDQEVECCLEKPENITKILEFSKTGEFIENEPDWREAIRMAYGMIESLCADEGYSIDPEWLTHPAVLAARETK
jgi:hypothetical protein